jgi:hypothetical protein
MPEARGREKRGTELVGMDLKDDLRTALECMGGTAEDVAATMRAEGVQGVRNAVRVLNPVVRLLQNTLRQDNLELDVMTGKTVRLNSGKEEVALPEAVRQFLDAFNRGAYRDLELSRDKT